MGRSTPPQRTTLWRSDPSQILPSVTWCFQTIGCMISKVAVPRLDFVTTIVKLFGTELWVTNTSIVYLSSRVRQNVHPALKRIVRLRPLKLDSPKQALCRLLIENSNYDHHLVFTLFLLGHNHALRAVPSHQHITCACQCLSVQSLHKDFLD